MTLRLDIDDLDRDINYLIEEIPKIHRDYQALLVEESIYELVVRSPVLTGAYRAAHAVGRGLTSNAPPVALVYDSPEHPVPGIDLEEGGEEPEPPNPIEAREAWEQEAPFQCAILVNDRHYADQVEYGWPGRAGYAIYGAVEAIIENSARRLVQVQDEPRLRR